MRTHTGSANACLRRYGEMHWQSQWHSALAKPVAPGTGKASRTRRICTGKASGTRRGFTLLEVMTAVSMSTVLLGIAVGLLAAVLQIDHGAQEQTRWAMTAGRLADQFRRDVHQAVAAAAEDGQQPSIELRIGPDRAVVYQVEPGRVVRFEKTGPAGGPEEWFVLPEKSTASFAYSRKGTVPFSLRENRDSPHVKIGAHENRDSPPRMVSLRIESPTPAGPTVRIDAEVSRDHRFEPKEGTP